jgi:hypothetical protein
MGLPSERSEPTEEPRASFSSLFRPRVRREPDSIVPAPDSVEPEPWSTQGMLTLALLVAVFQIPLAILFDLQDHGTYPFGSYLVVTLAPAVIPLPLIAAFLLAMPLARKMAGEARRMRVLETMSVVAIVYILLIGSWVMVLNTSGHKADLYDRAQMVGFGFADLVSLVLGALAFPLVYRRFWMPRRRMRGPR